MGKIAHARQARIGDGPRGERGDSLAKIIRDAAIAGRLRLGQRLETREALARRHGLSVNTVQRALDQLTKEGFLNSRRGAGTFVAEHIPSAVNYGLVIWEHTAQPEYKFPRFWSLLQREAENYQRSHAPKQFEVFRDFSPHADNETQLQLARTLRSRRLAGMFVPSVRGEIEETDLLRDPGVPKVSLADRGEGWACVVLDQPAYLDRAAQLLLDRGRKRVAVLSIPGWGGPALRPRRGGTREGILQRLRMLGCKTEARWVQIVDATHFDCAAGVVELLLHPEQSQRPNALILCDDYFVNPACAAMLALGIDRNALEIVAYCNYPDVPRAPFDVINLGFDARQILDAAVAQIDAQRRRGIVPRPAWIFPQADWELGAPAWSRDRTTSRQKNKLPEPPASSDGDVEPDLPAKVG